FYASGDDTLGGGGVGDVALDGHGVRVVGGGDGAGGGDDGVAELAVALDDRGTEAPRGAGDDCDLLDLRAHDDDLLRDGGDFANRARQVRSTRRIGRATSRSTLRDHRVGRLVHMAVAR